MVGHKKEGVAAEERYYRKRYDFGLRGLGHRTAAEKGTRLTAQLAVNCDCRGGSLRNGLRMRSYLVGGSTVAYSGTVQAVFPVRRLADDGNEYAETVAVVNESGGLYVYDETTKAFVFKTSGGGRARLTDSVGTDKRVTTVFAYDGGVKLLDEDLQVTDTGLTGTGAACFYRHRLFVGVKPSLLYYSAPNDFGNFTSSTDDGGWVSMYRGAGEIVALCEHRNMLYIFCEYGILRMAASGSAKHFSPTRLRYGGEKIFGSTVCVCGSAIFFLAKDGVYRMENDCAERLDEDVRADEAYERLFGCASYGGRAYLRYVDGEGVSRVLAAHEDGKSLYYAIAADGLSGGGGRALARYTGKIVCLDDGGALPTRTDTFQTAALDFGTTKRKRLIRLYFEGTGNFSVTLQNGTRSVRRTVRLTNGRAEQVFDERGESFYLTIALQRGARVDGMTVCYSVPKVR